MEKIDSKLLQGLVMTGAKTEITKKDGKKTRVSTPWKRPATPDDVLNWTDLGDSAVIVLKNGTKNTVEKKPGKEEKK